MQSVEIRKTQKGYAVVLEIKTLVGKRLFNTKEEAWEYVKQLDMDTAFAKRNEAPKENQST